MDIKLYVPGNLRLDKLNKVIPMNDLTGVKEDYLAYICHAIIIRKAFMGDEDFEYKKAGYVPLSSRVLQDIIPNYKGCIDYMVNTGVIECDNHYIPEKVSKGYRFSDEYWGVEYAGHKVTEFTLYKKLKRGLDAYFDSFDKKPHKKYPHLTKWFKTNKLAIDIQGAEQWIKGYKEEQMIKIRQSGSAAEEGMVKMLNEKCNGYKLIIEHFSQKQYGGTVDSSGFRFHTILTRLKKELRQYVTYEGKKLASIDISCSQPYMGLILLDPAFWKKRSKQGKKGFQSLDKGNYEKVYDAYHRNPYTIMLQKNFKRLYQSDVSRQQYIQLVTSGDLYDHLLKVIKIEKREEDSLKRYDRNDAKKMVMKALYCNERYPFNQLCNSYNMIFKRTFPSMGKLFSIVKFCDYKCLPILLQRIESHVVLELICKRISRERPDLPLFTIHDSIITYEENLNYVRDVMSEELRKYIGYPANLKTEFWDVQKNFEANNLSRVPVNYQ